MAEQHQQMQLPQAQQMTAQILNVQAGVATLEDSVPVQIMMPTSVVLEEATHLPVQPPPPVMQEMPAQPQEDPKVTNRKELSKQWKSLCKKAKQWCSMHDDSVPNFVMMYLDENRLVWEGPDHMESFISDESVISAFLRTSALSESLMGMEKRGADEMHEASQRPVKKHKKTEEETNKEMSHDEVIASLLETKPEESQESEQGGDAGVEHDSDNDQPSRSTDEPSQSTSEAQSQGGEGDVLSQVIESVIKDWAPGQGPPPAEGQEGDANVPEKKLEAPEPTMFVSLVRGSAMSALGNDVQPEGDGVSKEYSCPCGIIFPTKRSFRNHMQSGHTGPNAFQCVICEKDFKTGPRFKSHMLMHEDSGTVGPYSCSECPLKFKVEAVLQIHLQKEHGKIETTTSKDETHMFHTLTKNITCSMCSVGFKSKLELKEHARTVHGPEKKFQCHHCGKKFSYVKSLQKHLELHERSSGGGSDGENQAKMLCASRQPCVCDQCGKTLSSRRSLKMHKLWVHQGVKPFPCPHCPRQYCQRRDLDHHVNITHGGPKLLKIEVNSKGRRVVVGRGKHSCKICNRMFCSRQPLEIHMRIHTGEKPFSCETCKRAFARNSDLVKHRRMHTGEKPYACPECDKRFRSISNMKLHARKACKYEMFGPLPPAVSPGKTETLEIEASCLHMDTTEVVYANVPHEEQVEVTYATEGELITDSNGTTSYQVILPHSSGQSELATIEVHDLSQAVNATELVYVTKSLLHDIPSSVPEPSTSEIHMAADTIAQIEAIHNAQINRGYNT